MARRRVRLRSCVVGAAAGWQVEGRGEQAWAVAAWHEWGGLSGDAQRRFLTQTLLQRCPRAGEKMNVIQRVHHG